MDIEDAPTELDLHPWHLTSPSRADLAPTTQDDLSELHRSRTSPRVPRCNKSKDLFGKLNS